MNPVRVLVVDDSVVTRRMLSDILSADSGIEVVATASNGRLALQKLEQHGVDVVVLDVEMPVMDGLTCLVEIRAAYPKVRVIMFSTLTEHGARVTLEALTRGASDYVAKPSNTQSVAESIERVRSQLVPRVKALGARARQQPAPAVRSEQRPQPPQPIDGSEGGVEQPLEAVVIGVSTGGPKALDEVIPQLPADLGVPVLVVQHMPAIFTKLLAERLDGVSRLAVEEATEGRAVEPGLVLVAPGGSHMLVADPRGNATVRITDDPPEHSCRPAADPLFRSAARVWGASTLAVVLTGMGHDGCAGARAIHEAGGHVIAQDEATSVVWGMPGAVVRAGLADAELPIDMIAASIAQRVSRRAVR